MTDPKQLEGHLREILERSIRGAIEDASASNAASTHPQRFLVRLGHELLESAKRATPATAHLVRSNGEFFWDIFIGQFGTAEDGVGAVLTKGLWAVESVFLGGYQDELNKLIAANVEQRLFVLPGGTGLIGGLQRQCNVANVACWFAEVSRLEEWRADADFQPWVKLQYIPTRR